MHDRTEITPGRDDLDDREVAADDCSIPTVDGCRLAATAYRPEGTARGTVVVTSALAMPRTFYRQFAAWFARRGFDVLTFDYRGIADSAPDDPAAADATIVDWGERDIPAALSWARRELASEPLFVFGHSMGGQILGMIGDRIPLDGAVTFSAQSGYWRLQYPGHRIKLLVAMGALFPAVTRAFGYLPWSRIVGGTDIPEPVAHQWMRWCMNPDYLLGDPEVEGRRYHEFSAPILAYSFEDDVWGYREAVDWMMERYCNAKLERLHLTPEEAGVERIGHFGFFRPGVEHLWCDLLQRLPKRQKGEGKRQT